MTVRSTKTLRRTETFKNYLLYYLSFGAYTCDLWEILTKMMIKMLTNILRKKMADDRSTF